MVKDIIPTVARKHSRHLRCWLPITTQLAMMCSYLFVQLDKRINIDLNREYMREKG